MQHRNRTQQWIALLATVAATASSLTACSDDEQAEEAAPAAAGCTAETRDMEALAVETRCVRDDDCPCGGHCDLGVCAHECVADDDCGADRRCDLHGRCRGADDTSNVAPAPAEPAPIVDLSTSGALLGDDAERIDFAVLERALPRARWVAEPGTQVSCEGPDTGFDTSCVLTDLAPGGHTVWVRRGDPAALPSSTATRGLLGTTRQAQEAAAPPGLSVYTPQGRRTVAFVPAPEAPPPTEGTYRGLATLASMGSLTKAGDLSAPVGLVALPIDAEVYPDGPGAYRIALDNAVGLFGPDASWVIAVADDGAGGWTAQAPPPSFVRSNGVDLVAEVSWTLVSVGSAIDLSFELRLMGALAGGAPADDGALVASWDLSLSRRGDLPEGAMPALGTGEPIPSASSNAAAPLPWEQAAQGALASVWTAALAGPVAAALTPAPALWQCESGQNPYQLLCDSLWSAAGGQANCTTYAFELAQGRVVCDTVPNPTATRCTQAGQLGCVVTVDAARGLTFCEFTSPKTAIPDATRAEQCAQAYLCWEPSDPASGSPVDYDSSLLSTSLALDQLAVAGDMRCAGAAGPASATLGFQSNPDRRADGTDLLSSDMLEVCATELEDYWAGPGAVSRYEDLYDGSARCVNAARFEPALMHALEIEIAQALGQAAQPPSGKGGALALRLLYQWIQIHAFLAREALESDTLTRILTGDDVPLEQNLRTLDEYLELSLKGWDLLLTPRVASALAQVSDLVLADPDYREWLTEALLPEVPLLHHEQGVGLPVVMAEAVAVQLEAARALVSRARYAGTGEETALSSASETMRYAIGVMSFAESLSRTAAPLDAPWMPRWDAMRGGAYVALQGLLDELQALRERTNPLGIDEANLPLYYFGAPVDPGSRYNAVSDFLIGRSLAEGTTVSAWAPAAVARAEASLETASAEWVTLRTRELGRVLADGEATRRVGTLATRYGEAIINLCGHQEWGADQVVDDWTGTGDYTPETCWLVQSLPGCEALVDDPARLGRVLDLIEVDDARFSLCVGATLHAAVGELLEHVDATAGVNTVLRSGSYQSATLGGSGNQRTVTVGGTTFPAQQLYEVSYAGATPAQMERAFAVCRAQYPKARTSLPAGRDLDGAAPSPDCVQAGTMGDTAIAIVSARQDWVIAREEVNEHAQSFEIAMDVCKRKTQLEQTLNALDGVKLGVVTGLRAAKLAMDIAVVGAETAAATAEATSGLKVINPVSVALATVSHVTLGATKSASLGLEFAIDTAIDGFDLAIAAVERRAEVDICLKEARGSLVGARAAALRAEKALYDLTLREADLDGAKAQLDHIVREGKAALATERARISAAQGARAPLSNERWVSESIETYRREFRLAQRLTYLATRVAEWEQQRTLGARGSVLAALHPSELRAVLDGLITSGVSNVNGSTPSDLVTVISLKTELLQLGDNGHYDESQRFSDYLAARKAFDADGKDIGIEIPFTLVPDESDEAGAGVAVFAKNDCAERLWSVSASVLGPNLFHGNDDTASVRIDLLKSNAFFSQWCGTPPADEPFQIASIRPSVNPFADPYYGEAADTQRSAADPASTFSRARMRAFVNVDRADLEKDEYADGDSAELAARGLYGEYRLFIPNEVLSVDGRSPGLRLDGVDDILLRLEYVSVAR